MHLALDKALSDLKKCEEQKVLVKEELALVEESLSRVKSEKHALDSQIATLISRRQAEESKSKSVRADLSERIRDVEREVDRLSNLYRELSTSVTEVED